MPSESVRTIALISEDSELLDICQQASDEIAGQAWRVLRAVDPAEITADVFLWDWELKTEIFPKLSGGMRQHLFLVHRNDLNRFQKEVPGAEARVLLKPVTKATLRVFLSQAISACAAGDHAAAVLREDRDEILQCLIQTNLRLQEYDQDRTTFLARAVHDFRAPLTALSGYCGLLLSEPLGPLTESQKEVLRRMQHSARRLSRMANAMFQLSVGRHVVRRPDLQAGDVRECLEQALHEIGPFADDKNIAIRADLAPCDFALHFEAGQIEQVLINILDNACKFAPKAGVVDIRGYSYFWERRREVCALPPEAERRSRHTDAPNCYRIDIQDSGSPIPPDFLEQIFEEYMSYGGSRDRSGGGLGLAITRMIMNQHEGRVWAENTVSGPRFSLVLPFQSKAPERVNIEQLGKSA